MSGSRSDRQQALSRRRIPTLLLLLAVVSLTVFLSRPICSAMPTHGHAHDSASCCLSVTDAGAAKSFDVLAGSPGPKPLAAPLVLFFLPGVALFLGVTARIPRDALPQRSFYARSARILR